MLLRFSVENHLSISGRQELTLAASSLKDRRDGLIDCAAVSSGTVVPAVVIYGANASGKTNLVDAVSTMRKLVLWSHTKGEPGGGVPRKNFLLDPAWSEKPSSFEMDFVLDGVRYHYGFETTDESFTSEWLYEIPKAHKRKMFERAGQIFAFGRWLKGQNSSIAKLTRPNSLFLSAAAQNSHEQLSRIYRYFRDIDFSGPISVSGIEASTQVVRDGLDDRVIDFLQSINTGVTGYRKEETELSEESLALRQKLQAVFAKIPGLQIEIGPDDEDKVVEIQLSHRGKDGSEVYLDLGLESAGTRRLLPVLSQVFRALGEGRPIFIDELDTSLHTYASEAILKLFCSPKANRNGAQLVATTHDTNLMRSPVLRRDQLWFAEQNSAGATEIYPLTDIRTRKGDNMELGYLQGRYGAVPINDPVATMFGPESNG